MKNLRSDAALKRILKDDHYVAAAGFRTKNDVLIHLFCGDLTAEISLRDIISKRASLRGIEKRQRAALRPKKKLPLAERTVKYDGYTGKKTVKTLKRSRGRNRE